MAACTPLPSALFCEWMSSVGMSLALDHLNGLARTAGAAARAATAAAEISASLSFMGPPGVERKPTMQQACQGVIRGFPGAGSAGDTPPSSACRRGRRDEAHRPVPGLRARLGVVAVAHDADADQGSGLLAEGAFVVGADVPLVVEPLVEPGRPGLHDDLADAVGART